MSIDTWQQDPEFQALDPSRKARVYLNYFDQRMADEEFSLLPSEQQRKIKINFLHAKGVDLGQGEIGEVETPGEPAEVPQYPGGYQQFGGTEEKPSDVYEGLIKPTAKAIPRVVGSVAGGLALLPGAGIRAGIELLPTVSTDPNKAIDWGSIEKSGEIFNEIMSVPGRLITTEEEAKAVENLGLAMKPIEMAGEGWRLIGKATDEGLQKLGLEPTYIEPLLATYGEAAAVFAIPEVVRKIKSSNVFRRMTMPERSLVTQQVAKWYRDGISEAELLRRLGPESELWKRAAEVRAKGEIVEDILTDQPVAAEKFQSRPVEEMIEIRDRVVRQRPEIEDDLNKIIIEKTAEKPLTPEPVVPEMPKVEPEITEAAPEAPPAVKVEEKPVKESIERKVIKYNRAKANRFIKSLPAYLEVELTGSVEKRGLSKKDIDFNVFVDSMDDAEKHVDILVQRLKESDYIPHADIFIKKPGFAEENFYSITKDPEANKIVVQKNPMDGSGIYDVVNEISIVEEKPVTPKKPTKDIFEEERWEAMAIRLGDGTIKTGPTHPQIWGELTVEQQNSVDLKAGDGDLVLSTKGRLLPREEANFLTRDEQGRPIGEDEVDATELIGKRVVEEKIKPEKIKLPKIPGFKPGLKINRILNPQNLAKTTLDLVNIADGQTIQFGDIQWVKSAGKWESETGEGPLGSQLLAQKIFDETKPPAPEALAKMEKPAAPPAEAEGEKVVLAPDTRQGRKENKILKTMDGTLYESSKETHTTAIIELDLDPDNVIDTGIRNEKGEIEWAGYGKKKEPYFYKGEGYKVVQAKETTKAGIPLKDAGTKWRMEIDPETKEDLQGILDENMHRAEGAQQIKTTDYDGTVRWTGFSSARPDFMVDKYTPDDVAKAITKAINDEILGIKESRIVEDAIDWLNRIKYDMEVAELRDEDINKAGEIGEAEKEADRSFEDEAEQRFADDERKAIREEGKGDKDIEQTLAEWDQFFEDVKKPDRPPLKLTTTEPTPEEKIQLEKMKGRIKAPEKGEKPRPVIPTEKIKAPTTGKQATLLPPEKGETGELFQASHDKQYENASVGTYATGAEQYAAPLKSVIDLPEMVELSKQLMKGKLPHIKTKLGRDSAIQGLFKAGGLGRILLRADIFKDIAQTRAVLAHEIGHLVDYLPDELMTRGNILGRIATLKKFMKHTLPREPGGKTELTEKDRQRLRRQAKKLIEAEYKDKWIDEEIIRELPIQPDDVLAIWNSVESALEKNPELYRFIQMLNTAEKKAVIKEALKGQVPSQVQQFSKKISEQTGKKIKAEIPDDAISKRYQDLISQEIEKLRLFKLGEMMDELKTLTRAWKPFDPAASAKFTKYRYSSKELYADAISALFNAPGLLKSTAPNFYEGFFNYLERKPEVKRLYEGIQDSIRAGTTDKELTERTFRAFRRGDDAYARRLDKKSRYFDQMMRELVDTHWMVVKKVRQIGDQNIDPRKNPRYKLEEMVYTGSEIEWMLGQTLHGVIKPLEKAGLTWDDFGFYRFLKRVSTERGEIANPMGWHQERAQKKLDALEKDEWKGLKWEVINEVDNAFNKTRSYLVEKAKEAGRYDNEFMKTMEGNIGDYATFDVAHYIEERNGALPSAKIFQQIGTFQDIANPATATLLKDIAILKAVNRQVAAESVVDFLKEHYPKEIKDADTRWNGKFHEIKDPPRGQDQALIVFLKNGKPEGYYVDKWVADIFERNPIESMWISKALRVTAKPFRAVFTELNPGFWLFNIYRDYFRAAQMLPAAKVTTFAKYWAKGINPSVRSVYGIPDDVVAEMQKNNMLISIEGVRGLSPQDREIERMLARYRLLDPRHWNQKILKQFGNFFNHFSNIGRVIERMPKVGGYMYLKEKFPDMPPEVIGHIVRTRAGSPDFLRVGRAYPIYNNILLFSNPMKEGYRGDYEAMSQNPGEFWWKKAKYIYAPKALMYAAGIGLLGAGIKTVMDGVSDYDMANYVVIPLGLTPNGKSIYLRIPTDEGNRLLGGVFMKALQKDKPKYIGRLFDYMAGQAPTVHPGIDALIGIVQYATGHNPYDSFRGRFAIPEQVFQAYDERSHKAFLKWLANKSGTSIVYRFQTDDIDRIKGELEKVLNYPIASNIIGRFIKVSDVGIREDIKIEREMVKRENARKILDAKEALTKWINEEPLTADDVNALAEKPDVLDRNLIRFMARKHGNVIAEELWSVYQTGTTQEKVAVINKINELDALGGRTAKEFRWFWQKKPKKETIKTPTKTEKQTSTLLEYGLVENY